MTHERTNFLIPELNVVSNDVQLKHLQQRALMDHYNNHMKNKQTKYQPPSSPSTSPLTHKYEEYKAYDRVKKNYDHAIKSDLNDFYLSELARKEQLRSNEKSQKIRDEQQILQKSQRIQAEEAYRTKQLNHQFRKEAMQLVAERQVARQEKQRREKEEKNLFKQRYSLNTISLNKKLSYNQHYNNVITARDKLQQDYISTVIPKNNKVQEKKQRIVERGLNDKDYRLRSQLQQQNVVLMRNRNDLKEALIRQIEEKAERKKSERQVQKQTGYTSPMYRSIHHPINNPINFKITHDNKYIIQDVGTQSTLARNGSQTFLS